MSSVISKFADGSKSVSQVLKLAKAEDPGVTLAAVKKFAADSGINFPAQERPVYEYFQPTRNYEIVFFCEVPGIGGGYDVRSMRVCHIAAPTAKAALLSYLFSLPDGHSHRHLYDRQVNGAYRGMSHIEALPVPLTTEVIQNALECGGLVTPNDDPLPVEIIRHYKGTSVQLTVEQWERERSDLSAVKRAYAAQA
jgi:hypothetical protein